MELENEARSNAGEQEVATPEGNQQGGVNPELADQEAERANNSRMAAARKSGRAEQAKEWNNRIAGLGRVNPATGKRMESMDDVFAYFEAQQRSEDEAEAKKTGRSVEAIRADRTAMERGRSILEQERSAKDKEAKIDADIAEFIEEFPDVNLANALKGPFNDFLTELGEGVSLSKAWKAYSKRERETEAEKRTQSKNERSTGGGGAAKPSALTAAQRMQLEQWNAEMPSLAMTEEEFAQRNGQ